MPGVERLQKIEGFRTANLAYQDAIRPVSQRGSEEVGNCHWRQRSFLSERRLCSSRFQAKHVRFVEMNLRGFLDQDDAIAIRNVCGQGVQKSRFAGTCAARDQNVLLPRHRRRQF